MSAVTPDEWMDSTIDTLGDNRTPRRDSSLFRALFRLDQPERRSLADILSDSFFVRPSWVQLELPL